MEEGLFRLATYGNEEGANEVHEDEAEDTADDNIALQDAPGRDEGLSELAEFVGGEEVVAGFNETAVSAENKEIKHEVVDNEECENDVDIIFGVNELNHEVFLL